MYDDLVKRLRNDATAFVGFVEENLLQAADAIEKMSEAYDKLSRHMDDLAALMPRWIPVTERLPENGKYVLCFCRANIVCVLRRDRDGDWYENPTHVYMSGFVTHWMPLPEPPED